MRHLLEQLERSLATDLYLLSLFAALTLPDIAGALDSEDGEASGAKYAAWYDKWVRDQKERVFLSALPPLLAAAGSGPSESPLTGEVCYRFRCSLLHQGTSQHPKSTYQRIIFVEPGASSHVLHCCLIGDALIIDVRTFCSDLINAARLWLSHVEGTERFISNSEKFVRRHATGLRPYVVGVPVIG